jgi:hypothetical protein
MAWSGAVLILRGVMTEERRIADRRRFVRRAPESDPMAGRALVPVEPQPQARAEPRDPKPRRANPAPFTAQVLGQGGQKRGLRGGPETLDKARSTYLETEWSGPADRRPHPGRITKTEI